MAIETGFPSPARGYEAEVIDLNHLLIHNPAASFFMRMKGTHLQYKSIASDDILVVDRSRPVLPGSLVVFRQEGEFLCRELCRNGGGFAFLNTEEAIIPLSEETEVFGVVVGVVRKL